MVLRVWSDLALLVAIEGCRMFQIVLKRVKVNQEARGIKIRDISPETRTWFHDVPSVAQ
jgi:hypothetical protein